MAILFKSCPKCSGTRSSEENSDGRYVTCLSCGHLTYTDAPVPLTLETEHREGYRLARPTSLLSDEGHKGHSGDRLSDTPESRSLDYRAAARPPSE